MIKEHIQTCQDYNVSFDPPTRWPSCSYWWLPLWPPLSSWRRRSRLQRRWLSSASGSCPGGRGSATRGSSQSRSSIRTATQVQTFAVTVTPFGTRGTCQFSLFITRGVNLCIRTSFDKHVIRLYSDVLTWDSVIMTKSVLVARKEIPIISGILPLIHASKTKHYL